VHLLAPVMDEAELKRRLAGWPDVCGREGSLEWLLARMGDDPREPEPAGPTRRVRRGAIRLGGPAGAAA
jgi:hypothetical protein